MMGKVFIMNKREKPSESSGIVQSGKKKRANWTWLGLGKWRRIVEVVRDRE